MNPFNLGLFPALTSRNYPLLFTTKYFTCRACHEPSPVTTNATDRVDLERERGARFRVTCRHCHKPASVHVNQVSAQPNRIVTGVGGIAGAVAIAALWNVGFIAYAAGALPVIVYQAQAKSAATFNGYKLPETRR